MTRPIDDYLDPRTLMFSEIMSDDGELLEVGEQEDRSDENLRAEDVLNCLRKRQRQVVILKSKGYNPDEVAKRLGISVWAVYRITLRIRKRLIDAGFAKPVVKKGVSR